MNDSAAAAAGVGFVVIFLVLGAVGFLLAILPYYYLSKIKEHTEQTRNNLRDLNARLAGIQRLDIVVPKVMSWIDRQGN